jgi:hypothetical protein
LRTYVNATHSQKIALILDVAYNHVSGLGLWQFDGWSQDGLCPECVGHMEYPQIAAASGQELDDVLAIQTAAISFGLQTIVEQALSLLSKLIESRGGQISGVVAISSELLRFGVPTQTACMLCSDGVRHRRAAILLAGIVEIQGAVILGRVFMFAIANQVLRNDAAGWRDRLGSLVYDNTLADVG